MKTKTPKIKEKIIENRGWMIVTKEGKEIGSGERGRKYIYWDKEEALEFIKERKMTLKDFKLSWKVVPVIIKTSK